MGGRVLESVLERLESDWRATGDAGRCEESGSAVLASEFCCARVGLGRGAKGDGGRVRAEQNGPVAVG